MLDFSFFEKLYYFIAHKLATPQKNQLFTVGFWFLTFLICLNHSYRGTGRVTLFYNYYSIHFYKYKNQIKEQ
jgi:hypothetical protein